MCVHNIQARNQMRSPLIWNTTSKCMVEFLPAETCFCRTFGLNWFKVTETWFTRAKARSGTLNTE